MYLRVLFSILQSFGSILTWQTGISEPDGRPSSTVSGIATTDLHEYYLAGDVDVRGGPRESYK